jgi:outer membrane lipoprotein-sorting protein
MRRVPVIAAALVLLAAVLTGCGSKSAESVVKDLDKAMSKLESYRGSGKMVLHTGQQPLEYKVDVWYQKPHYYRIALTNAKRDVTQIVLRNDDGVFVLTPSLNKSFRFQSDWPENQGQVYLYQTLAKSILLDNSRQFVKQNDAYVFDVMASNYQNGSFARQKIWLDKDNFAPKHVEVTDASGNLMVEVNFDTFEFGAKFEKSAFDTEQNLSQGAGTADAGKDGRTADQPSGTGDAPDSEEPAGTEEGPAAEEPGAEGKGDAPASEEAGDEPATAAPSGQQQQLVVLEPEMLPEGVVLKDVSEVRLGDKTAVMLRYTGTYDFTILETIQDARQAIAQEGIVLDLGFTVGHLSGYDVRTLAWSYDGMEFRLTSATLPDDEMVRIAQSMVEASAK